MRVPILRHDLVRKPVSTFRDHALGSVLGDLIGFQPRHFQDSAQRVEAVAFGDFGEFAGKRGYIVCGRIGGFPASRTVAVVSVRHYVLAAQFFGALPRWLDPLTELVRLAMF